jgi:hypothetical protein
MAHLTHTDASTTRSKRKRLALVAVPATAYVVLMALIAALWVKPPALGWIGFGIVALVGAGLIWGAYVLLPRTACSTTHATWHRPSRRSWSHRPGRERRQPPRPLWQSFGSAAADARDMLPLSDGLKTRELPIVNIGLIVANFGVWLFYELPNLNSAVYHASFYPCSVANTCDAPEPWAVSAHLGGFVFGVIATILLLRAGREEARDTPASSGVSARPIW